MAPEKTETASGKLRLSRYWKESASSHYETEDTADLIGQGDFVVLEIHHEESNMFKMREAIDRTKKYQIKVTDLIHYIKTNGVLLSE